MRLSISDQLFLDVRELAFTFARSGGPGGQNVNKLSTRVTLWFDVRQSPSLTPAQKARIAAALASRVDADGVLRVVSQRHRTQSANRRAATERFIELLSDALRRRPIRKPTRPRQSAVERRLTAKRFRSRRKQQRSGAIPHDD